MGFQRDMLIDDMMLAPSASDVTSNRLNKSRFIEEDEGFNDLEKQINSKPHDN